MVSSSSIDPSSGLYQAASSSHVDTVKKFPISKWELKLAKAVNQGLSWAKTQDALTPLRTSLNSVYKLGETAFFKVGAEDEPAVGTMETLVWNIAVFFGVENQFVPTTEVKVKTKTTCLRGGVQKLQKGCLLADVPKREQKTIDKKIVLDAILTSLVFGMHDEHAKNLMITKNREIRRFDNTRSFPNGNRFLIKKGVYPSFRSALLDLPQAHLPLTAEECKDLRCQLDSYQQKMEAFKDYLNSSHIQDLIGTLPPGWLQINAAFLAMKERIDLMQAALAEGKVRDLFELAERAVPDYKLAFVLQHTASMIGIKLPQIYLSKKISAKKAVKTRNTHVGKVDFVTIIDYLFQERIHIPRIKELCDQPDARIQDILMETYPLCDERIPEESVNIFRERTNALFSQMVSGAKNDFKDIPRKLCIRYLNAIPNERIKLSNCSALASVGIPHIKIVGHDIYDIFQRSRLYDQSHYLMTVEDKEYIVYKNSLGWVIKPVDIVSEAGMIIIDKQKILINSFS